MSEPTPEGNPGCLQWLLMLPVALLLLLAAYACDNIGADNEAPPAPQPDQHYQPAPQPNPPPARPPPARRR